MVFDSCSLPLRSGLSNSCPWSEWTSILDYISLMKTGLMESYKTMFNKTSVSECVELRGANAHRSLCIDPDNRYVPQLVWPTFSSTEQVPIANALFSAVSLWQLSLTNVSSRHGHGNPLSDQSNSIHTIENGVYQPYVTSCCAKDRYTGEDDKRPLVFPTLLGANDGTQTDTSVQQDFGPVPGITKFGIPRSDLLRKSEVDSDFHLKWIELSETNFNGSSIGAVILLPKHDGNQAQDILTCNLAAGWGLTKLKYDVAQSKIMDIPKNRRTAVPIEISNQLEGEQAAHYITFDYPYFPQKRTYFQNHFVTRAACFNAHLRTGMLTEDWSIAINITRSWAELFSARLEHSNTTIFNEIMQEQVWLNNARDYAPFVLSGLVANGLARLGFSSSLQGAVKTISKNGNIELDGNYWLSGKGDAFTVNATEAKDWTKLHMTSELQGHAYNTAGLAPKAAICILTTYCVLALCHIFYAGYSGKSHFSLALRNKPMLYHGLAWFIPFPLAETSRITGYPTMNY